MLKDFQLLIVYFCLLFVFAIWMNIYCKYCMSTPPAPFQHFNFILKYAIERKKTILFNFPLTYAALISEMPWILFSFSFSHSRSLSFFRYRSLHEWIFIIALEMYFFPQFIFAFLTFRKNKFFFFFWCGWECMDEWMWVFRTTDSVVSGCMWVYV